MVGFVVSDPVTDLAGMDHAGLVALVVSLLERVERLEAENAALKAENALLRAEIVVLRSKGSKNSGNSSLPPSRDPAGERQRQAADRQARKQRLTGGEPRRAGGQPGTPGRTLPLSATPDEVIDHFPGSCDGCGADLDVSARGGVQRRQVVDIPPVKPVVTEHRAHSRTCPCGTVTTGRFPDHVRAPISYGPGIRATVVYLLARQHIPVARVAEAMRDLFGVNMSTGTVDSICSDASRRLGTFITALVACLRSLAVIHVDETTDRNRSLSIGCCRFFGEYFGFIGRVVRWG